MTELAAINTRASLPKTRIKKAVNFVRPSNVKLTFEGLTKLTAFVIEPKLHGFYTNE